VYVRGTGSGGRVVSWLDASGKTAPLLDKPAEFLYPRLSPDGKRLAIVISQNGADNLWVYDPARDSMAPISSGTEGAGYPVWTPDGEFIAFFMRTLIWARADGSGAVERFDVGTPRTFPWSISSDGKRLAFFDTTGIRTARVEQTGAKMQLSQAEPAFQSGAAPVLSPDDRFMAYTSSGQVSVIPFRSTAQSEGAAATGTSQVSNDGGDWPVWPKGGTDIFYIGADRRIRAAGYSISGNSIIVGRPRVWSDRQLADVGRNPSFDMEQGGKRAVVLLNPGEEAKPETHIRAMLNVGDELLRRAEAEKKR